MRNRYAKYIAFAVVAMLLIVVATRLFFITPQQDTPRDYPEIAHSSVLNVAVDFSPLSYHIEGDSIGGFDYELLQLIGRKANLKIEIHPESSLSKSLELLDNRIYDIVAQQVPVTLENQQEYIFSKPLGLDKQVLIQRTDSNGNVNIRNQIDLAQCTLHIAKDAPTRLRIENLAQEIGDTIYICEMHNYGAEQLIILVATGEIEYAVCDEARAAIIATEYDNIDFKTDISFNQLMSWTMRQESKALRDSINIWLSSIQETPEYQELYTRYFGANNYKKHIELYKK